MNEISCGHVTRAIIQAFPDLTRAKRRRVTRMVREWYPDKSLEVPTLRDLIKIAKKIKRRPWTPGYDCDDFAETYLCAAKRENRHWAIGPVIFEKTPRTPGTHMMCISIAKTPKGKQRVVIIEPQRVGKTAAAHLLRAPGASYKLRCLKF